MNTSLIKTINDSFIAKFNSEPVLIFSLGRINIIGEHTDYNDGFVFHAAVDKDIVTAIQKSDSSVFIANAADKNETINFLNTFNSATS